MFSNASMLELVMAGTWAVYYGFKLLGQVGSLWFLHSKDPQLDDRKQAVLVSMAAFYMKSGEAKGISKMFFVFPYNLLAPLFLAAIMVQGKWYIFGLVLLIGEAVIAVVGVYARHMFPVDKLHDMHLEIQQRKASQARC